MVVFLSRKIFVKGYSPFWVFAFISGKLMFVSAIENCKQTTFIKIFGLDWTLNYTFFFPLFISPITYGYSFYLNCYVNESKCSDDPVNKIAETSDPANNNVLTDFSHIKYMFML